MKKFVVAILIVSLVLLNLVPALGEYDKPILFRNVPWGATYNEVIQTFPDSLTMEQLEPKNWFSSLDEVMYCGSSEIIPDSSPVVYYAEPKRYGFLGKSLEPLRDVKVAGYELENLELYFTLIPQNGEIVRAKPYTSLIYAVYHIKTNYDEAKSAFNDITNKLASLYGSYEQNTIEYISFWDSKAAHYFQNVWRGKDGTILSLVSQNHEGHIYIRYSFEGANDLVLTALNVEKQNNQQSTEGL